MTVPTCDLNPVAGREQGGVSRVVVVPYLRYAAVTGLFIVAVLAWPSGRSVFACGVSSLGGPGSRAGS